MSINISHALCAMLLQMTVLLQPVLNSAWSTSSLGDVKQQGQLQGPGPSIDVVQTNTNHSVSQFKLGMWLSADRCNLIEPLSLHIYAYMALVLLNDIPKVFMHVYLQMLGLKLVFQQLYFALQRYALLVMSRQPLPRFHLMR